MTSWFWILTPFYVSSLQGDHSNLTSRIPSSRYEKIRQKIKDKYVSSCAAPSVHIIWHGRSKTDNKQQMNAVMNCRWEEQTWAQENKKSNQTVCEFAWLLKSYVPHCRMRWKIADLRSKACRYSAGLRIHHRKIWCGMQFLTNCLVSSFALDDRSWNWDLELKSWLCGWPCIKHPRINQSVI